MTHTDILIYGGGASGVCAAVQAARLGARVTVIEPSPWIGGMITAAGVSALDGNKYAAGGGLVHEFRTALARHYGSIENLFTGWVSLYCFEPRVGHDILCSWTADLDSLTILRESDAVAYRRAGEFERDVTVRDKQGTEQTIRCRVFIDCTEYGDGLAMAGIPYRLGRESREELGESSAPERPDDELQDLTYVATLKRVDQPDESAGGTVSNIERAYWSQFQCSTSENCPTRDEAYLNHKLHDWESFLSYATLPNGRFMLNWPFRSNDYPITPAFFENRFIRRQTIAAARLHTWQNVRYIQDALGHPEWQLDIDQYPSGDGLALIPYIRESRRMWKREMMIQDDVVPRNGAQRAPFRPDAIAVGDYFLDHHHSSAFQPPGERIEEDYPDNGPFQVPIGVFLPDADDPCFLVGEKSIAVSHIVNGCTRLQPLVMLLGQALGALAAEAVRRGSAPADVPVADVQRILLDAGAQLYLNYDVNCEHPLFRTVQDLGMARVLTESDPLHVEPERPISADEAAAWSRRAGLPDMMRADGAEVSLEDIDTPLRDHIEPTGQLITRGDFLAGLHALLQRKGALSIPMPA
jgi:hypothetical protein